MSRRLGKRAGRLLTFAVGVLSLLCLTGDRGVRAVPPPGIDPLELLDLQVKNNVFLIIDTSGSMRWPVDKDLWTMGIDDPRSRFYQARQAIKNVVTGPNQFKVNWGMGTYSVLQPPKNVNNGDNDSTNGSRSAGANGGGGDDDRGFSGPFIYVSKDANAKNFFDSDTSTTPALNNFDCLRSDGTNTTRFGFFCEFNATDSFANQDHIGAATTDAQHREVWQSFRNATPPYPDNCIPGDATNPCYYYIESRIFRDNVQIGWDTSKDNDRTGTSGTDSRWASGPAAYTCPAPPAGLVGDTNDRPCVRMCDISKTPAANRCADFYFTSPVFEGPGNCGNGAAVLNTVAACAGDNSTTIFNRMGPALPFTVAGAPVSTILASDSAGGGTVSTLAVNTAVDIISTNRFLFSAGNTTEGLRETGGTPLGASMRSIQCAGTGACASLAVAYTAPAGTGTITLPVVGAPPGAAVFPTPPALVAGRQKNFVILLTDGDDLCGGWNDDQVVTAARELYYNGCAAGTGGTVSGGSCGPNSTDFTHQAETLLIAFSTGIADTASANRIARAGSGGNLDGTCPAGVPCRNAFFPTNLTQLNDALNAAIATAANTGTFSDQQSITESIFEYVAVSGATPTPSPMDPTTRYNSSVPILLSSTFVMPGYEGHLKAFRNNAGTSLELWDAGTKLLSRVTAGVTSNTHTFADLVGNATPTTVKTSTALLKRRIFTTTRAGVSSFLDGTQAAIVGNLTAASYFQPAEQITLWPTTSATDPGTYPTTGIGVAGTLDDELGLTAANFPTVLDFKTAFGACVKMAAGVYPAGVTCTSGDASGTTNWNFARKEARQIILAYHAGAQPHLDTSGPPLRTAGGVLRFKARAFILAESTLAAPAVVTPAIQAEPAAAFSEYRLYRDGLALDNGTKLPTLDRGFGMRNPDVDSNAATTAATAADPAIKPLMSVVYHASNAALHAFRAGPCFNGVCSDAANTPETGGEELWAFVPYDQLSKLRLLLLPPTRDNHVYMMAAPLRFADVFVPGAWGFNLGGKPFSGSGVWRTILLFGRGIGGKHLTALDITAPGPFTRPSLDANPPIHLWTRGNPDTQDLTAGGTKNASPVSPSAGTANFNAYATMGQTWSVPALAYVPAASNTTHRRSGGVDFVAYVGSGYSTVTTEGTTFYTLDILTGDVVASVDIGDRSPAPTIPDNALVANPVGFQPKQLVEVDVVAQTTTGHPASGFTERVYIGDVHGRLWRFMSTAPGTSLLFADVGANQPIVHPAAMLYYKGTQATRKPHVFLETGHDNRLKTPLDPPPGNTNVFKMLGLRDDDLTGDTDGAGDGVVGPAKVLFNTPFPDGYRGTVQPAVAYNGASPPSGRVFFVGVKFNPAGSPAASPCVSSFDSILYALAAESGGAAYDFGTNVVIEDQRVQAVRVDRGQLVLDEGLEAQNPPPPPAPPQPATPQPAPNANVFVGSAMGPGVPPPYLEGQPIPGVMPFRLSSSVCR